MSSNTQTAAKILNPVLSTIILLSAFLVPIFFLPVTADFFTINKHALLFFLAGLALILWTVSWVLRRRVRLTVSPLLLPLFLFTAASVATIFLSNAPRFESYFGRVGLSLATLVLFLIGSSQPAKIKNWLKITLLSSASLMGLVNILSYTKTLSFMGYFGPSWLTDPNFNLAGTSLNSLIFQAPLLALAIKFWSTVRSQNAYKQLLLIISIVLIASGLTFSAIQVFPDFKPQASTRLPLSAGWQIAIESLKEKPFWGVGPSNYLAAYTQYRPLSTNQNDIWLRRFTLAPNEFFETFTTMGLLGFITLSFLLFKILWVIKNNVSLKENHAAIPLLILLFTIFISPLNVVTFSLFSSLLILLVLEQKKSSIENPHIFEATLGLVALKEGLVRVENTPFPPYQAPFSDVQTKTTHETMSTAILPWLFLVVSLVLVGLTFWPTYRIFLGEAAFRGALIAITRNDGIGTYNKLIQALNFNPWSDVYHRQFADINLRLANSLASREKLSDQDRNNVSQLIQQSIREGKIAVQINSTNVQNWETLSRTYRALINVAPGAADWTVVTYTEAIRHDPVNPLLRLELGGVFYNLKDWESAIRNFQAAVNLKTDFANGYYNLALAYEQDGKLDQASRAMQATLQNLKVDSPDYKAAQDKLQELITKAGQKAKTAPPAQTEELSAPEPLPTPGPGANRVQLEETEAPPVSPTPETSPSPAISPTLTPAPTE